MNGSRLRTLLLSLAALAGACSAATAQRSDSPLPSPAMGTEYYVTFPQNEDGGGAATKFMGLMITAEVPTTGIVQAEGYFTTPFSVQPGEIKTIPISRNLELKESEEFPVAAVRITSRDPIAVFVVNSLYQSTGAYAALPVNLWGTHYTPLTLPNARGGRVSSFAVVAMHDSTRLTIIPSTSIYKKNAWENVKIVLKQGESYFVKARDGNPGVADLSISDIQANRPVAVVSSHVRTAIAADGAINDALWGSHQATMLLPDSLWGSEYLSVPARLEGDRFRMLAASEQTEVRITHYPPGAPAEQITVTLNRGQIYDSSTINGKPITGPVVWSASHPVMLAQMRTSGPTDNNAAHAPAMIPLYGLGQFSTRSIFVAPSDIGLDYFSKHTLTIIARGNPALGGNDPENPLRRIMLNGTPLHTMEPSLLSNRIGSTDFYYARVTINSGGYTLTSPEGYPFTATLTGNNGNLGGSYTWALPFWLPAASADATPPRVLSTLPQTLPNEVSVRFTDRTESYFSGIDNVTVINGSHWQVVGSFTRPAQDEDIDVRFRTTNDPSGPLYVEVRDRAGNRDTLKLHDGLCDKSAYPNRERLQIRTSAGRSARDSVTISANGCGDSAEVEEIIFSDGTAQNYINVWFSGDVTPRFLIPAGTSKELYFEVKPTTPQGTYQTTVTLRLEGASIQIGVDLIVDAPASADRESASPFRLAVAPNPITSQARISFGRPLGGTARIRINDYLGRPVRTLGSGTLTGSTEIVWDGLGDDGAAAPAGTYFIVVEEGTRRESITATILR